MIANSFSSRQLVIAAVRRHGAISRVELVKDTGLSAGTISNITRELVDNAILREVRKAAEGRGRPRTALSMNADAATFAGMVLYPTGHVVVQITDLPGKVLHTARYSIALQQEGEALIDALAEALRKAVEETDWSLPRPYGVGIGFFGTVETHAGILHWLPPMTPKPQPVQAALEERLGIPVFIDNDANIFARAQYWRRPEESGGKRHIVHIGMGLGLATVWDGVVQIGGRGVNAEFGHIKSSFATGRACPCGATGCLCTVASLAAIAQAGEGGIALENSIDASFYPKFEACAAKARAGDEPMRTLFEDAGSAMGVALANMINISNPEAIDVIVEDEAWIELAGPSFEKALHANRLSFLGSDFPVTLSVDNPEHHALGAIALVQERLLLRDPLPDWS